MTKTLKNKGELNSPTLSIDVISLNERGLLVNIIFMIVTIYLQALCEPCPWLGIQYKIMNNTELVVKLMAHSLVEEMDFNQVANDPKL